MAPALTTGLRYHESRATRAAFARATRQYQEWQARHRAGDLLRRQRPGRWAEPAGRGRIDADAELGGLAAAVLRLAIEDGDWRWLDSQEVEPYLAILGVDEGAWQQRVRQAREALSA